MMLLLVIGTLLGLIVLYLVSIIFLPILKVDNQSIHISNQEKEAPECRETIKFEVGNINVSGWFYKPEQNNQSTCIIMSHGFGGTKDMALENYALKFRASGYSVLLYDYRYFGESGGSPRQLYSALDQIEDLKAAIAYARSRDDVNEEAIVLWGTSAGATYGVLVASEDRRIAGVIAQCGAFDHKEDSKLYIEQEGMGFFMKLMVHAQRDKGRSRFGLSPHTFPAYGKPGTVAMLTAPGAFEGISMLAKESVYFKNEMCARLALMPHAADPTELAKSIECPVQILVCEKDTLVSPKSHHRLVAVLKDKAYVKQYPIGHFDLYNGDGFVQSTDDQIDFLDTVISVRINN